MRAGGCHNESGAMRGPRHRRRWIVLAGVAVLLLFVALTARLFIYPDINAPERADAIVVLGGASPFPGETGSARAKGASPPLLPLSLVPNESCIRSLPRCGW